MPSLHTKIVALTCSLALLCAAAPLLAQAQTAAGGGGGAGGGNNLQIEKKGVQLLEPLDEQTKELQARPGVQIFFDYFNLAWPWLMGTAAGVAVLQAMIGGVQVMMSGGNEGERSEGMDKLKWSLAGFLMLAFAGLILRTLNPIFYK